MEDPKLKRLQEMLKLLDSQLSKEDFVSAFEGVIKYSKDAHGKTEAKVNEILSSMDILFNEIRGANERILSAHKGELDSKHKEAIKKLEESISSRLAELKDGRDGKNGKDADENAIFSRVLEKLAQKKEKRLTLTDIEGWREFFAEYKKFKERPQVIGGWSAAGGGKIVKSYDLSSSLNGVLSTFSLPAFWRVISVHLSSYPNILQPITDYTTDQSAMTITFNATVQPSTSLAAGQTLLVVYAEP